MGIPSVKGGNDSKAGAAGRMRASTHDFTRVY
jgi:hypothetical protein